jgi:hypothetical protein
MSNIWESMQRGLEKASQEAARIGRMQRLRSTVDSLSRQLTTQNNLLVVRAMEIFTAGQMTQSELLPICQDLQILKQELEQAQHELKALMNQGTAQAGQTSTGPYPPNNDITATIPSFPPTQTAPPPPGYSPLESTRTIPAPPPPPGVEPLTISALDTQLVNSDNPSAATQNLRCPQCQAELVPEYSYCQNCGSRIDRGGVEHLPTVRSGFYPTGQEAAQADATNPIADQATIRSTDEPAAHVADLETIRGEPVVQGPDNSTAKEKGDHDPASA